MYEALEAIPNVIYTIAANMLVCFRRDAAALQRCTKMVLVVAFAAILKIYCLGFSPTTNSSFSDNSPPINSV